MTSLQKNIISMILPFALWALDSNSQIVVSTTFPTNQEINEEENLMGLIYSKSSPSLAVEVSGRVVEIIADVGDEVKAGDILAKIDSEKYNLQFSQAKAEIARLDALLVNQEFGSQAS